MNFLVHIHRGWDQTVGIVVLRLHAHSRDKAIEVAEHLCSLMQPLIALYWLGVGAR